MSASLVASNPVEIPRDSRIPEQRLAKMKETEKEAVHMRVRGRQRFRRDFTRLCLRGTKDDGDIIAATNTTGSGTAEEIVKGEESGLAGFYPGSTHLVS